MRVECWITKATETHSEYVIHIAFTLQQWLRERASLLRYTTLPVLLYWGQTVFSVRCELTIEIYNRFCSRHISSDRLCVCC